jgi:hypothetical protein
MSKIHSWALVSIGVVALAVGALLATGALSSAQTATPSTPTADQTATVPSTSNEDPAHEAAESAEWEAQEDSGQWAPGGGGTFTPNEDPAHEAAESAEWEAQEDAGQAPTGQAPTAPNSSATPGA